MSDDDGAMDPETLVRTGVIETLNQGKTDKAPEFFSDDLDYHNSDDDHGDFETLLDDSLEFSNAFPDLEGDIQETVVKGDSIMFRYTVRGTHEQHLNEVPPTGNSFETQGIGYATLRDGQIDEYNLVFDRLGMLQQLGIV